MQQTTTDEEIANAKKVLNDLSEDEWATIAKVIENVALIVIAPALVSLPSEDAARLISICKRAVPARFWAD